MKKYAVIVAAGAGTRMNSDVPKQFMLLKKKPVLFYCVDTFLKAYADVEIILVLPPENMAKGQEIIDDYFTSTSRIRICEGGRSRFLSVKNGLVYVKPDSIVFVHDAVRCLLSEDLVQRCYRAAKEFGSAIPSVKVKESIRLMKEEDESEALDRELVRVVQTPQTFHSNILLPAYNIDYKPIYTDEATVAEVYGLKVHLIEGEENNIKITTPADLARAEVVMG
jgi:2-C-methyl-D-erythritol 4-phosphate cytidylyltransferase